MGVMRGESLARYAARKLVSALVTILLVTLLSFLLMRLTPIDPAEAYVKRNSAMVTQEQIDAARIQLGLDRPLLVQYGSWLAGAVRGDFGISLATGHPVAEELGKAIPTTLAVVGLSAVLTVTGVVLTGLAHYFWRDRAAGRVLGVLALLGISIPAFYLATAFLDLFSLRWGVINVAGNRGLAKYLPAALCLSVSGICFYGRMLGDGLTREMDKDYCGYARCRGLTDRRIALRHALPHVVIDLLPNFAQMLGLCLAGAAIVERVFSLSGLGYLIIDSVIKRDSPMSHAAILFLALVLAALDILAGLLQGVLDRGRR